MLPAPLHKVAATPKGITIDGMPLTKTSLSKLSPCSQHYVQKAAALMKSMKPEDWEKQIMVDVNHVPKLVEVGIYLSLANPIPMDKYNFNPDQPRDEYGRWTDEDGDPGEPEGNGNSSASDSASSSRPPYQIVDAGNIATDANVDNSPSGNSENVIGTLTPVGGMPVANSKVIPYFDASIMDQIRGFFQDVKEQEIPVVMTEGFRTNDMQSQVAGNQYGGATAGNSLHEAGFAFDINWHQLTDAQKEKVLNIAAQNGLEWGGTFRHPSDPVHFYIDPFDNISERRAYIPKAQQQFRTLREK